MDREAWRATVHRITKSLTRLSIQEREKRLDTFFIIIMWLKKTHDIEFTTLAIFKYTVQQC